MMPKYYMIIINIILIMHFINTRDMIECYFRSPLVNSMFDCSRDKDLNFHSYIGAIFSYNYQHVYVIVISALKLPIRSSFTSCATQVYLSYGKTFFPRYMILPFIMKLTNLILILADYIISIFPVERFASGIRYDLDTILCDTLPYVI